LVVGAGAGGSTGWIVGPAGGAEVSMMGGDSKPEVDGADGTSGVGFPAGGVFVVTGLSLGVGESDCPGASEGVGIPGTSDVGAGPSDVGSGPSVGLAEEAEDLVGLGLPEPEGPGAGAAEPSLE
jgi:hypothetical protein